MEKLLESMRFMNAPESEQKELVSNIQEIGEYLTLEDVRMALGELLPGSFTILAASMDLSNKELTERLKLGYIKTEDVFDKFASDYLDYIKSFSQTNPIKRDHLPR